MQKRILSLILCFSLGITLATAGCARKPSKQRAVNLMDSYFNKYGKKYPDSVFGDHKVDDVKLLHIEEIQKKLVAAYAILNLEQGPSVQVRCSIERKPLGWSLIAWENMGMVMGPTE